MNVDETKACNSTSPTSQFTSLRPQDYDSERARYNRDRLERAYERNNSGQSYSMSVLFWVTATVINPTATNPNGNYFDVSCVFTDTKNNILLEPMYGILRHAGAVDKFTQEYYRSIYLASSNLTVREGASMDGFVSKYFNYGKRKVPQGIRIKLAGYNPGSLVPWLTYRFRYKFNYMYGINTVRQMFFETNGLTLMEKRRECNAYDALQWLILANNQLRCYLGMFKHSFESVINTMTGQHRLLQSSGKVEQPSELGRSVNYSCPVINLTTVEEED